MLVIPAIDLRNGEVVRLRQGQANDITTFSENPKDVARMWASQGASWIHVVDLDGAFAGSPQQLDIVSDIAAAVSIPLQLGGGIRSETDIEKALDAGASRIVIGSIAATNLDLAQDLLASYQEQLAIAIDTQHGIVRVSGWTEASSWTPLQLIARLSSGGATRFILTDVSRDGMLNGPDIGLLGDVIEATRGSVIASGGVESLDDIRQLASTDAEAVIVGMALYEGRILLPEAIAAARRS